MRHQLSGRQLSRNSPHRHALLRNMSVSLLRHETIRTTLPKAKELRRVVEPLITLGKSDSEANRRLAFSRLRARFTLEQILAASFAVSALRWWLFAHTHSAFLVVALFPFTATEATLTDCAAFWTTSAPPDDCPLIVVGVLCTLAVAQVVS